MLLCFAVSVLVLTVCLRLTARIVPGIRLRDTQASLAAGLVLALLRVTLGKLLAFLCLPLGPLNFGLTAVLIWALLLRLTARLVRGLEVRGWGATLLGALCLSILWKLGSWILF